MTLPLLSSSPSGSVTGPVTSQQAPEREGVDGHDDVGRDAELCAASRRR